MSNEGVQHIVKFVEHGESNTGWCMEGNYYWTWDKKKNELKKISIMNMSETVYKIDEEKE